MQLLSKLFAAGVLALVSFAASAADIVDTAISAGQFNTLVKAVQEAGLVATLKGPGPFTVFAPTVRTLGFLRATRGVRMEPCGLRSSSRGCPSIRSATTTTSRSAIIAR